jgi:hypothetical protein
MCAFVDHGQEGTGEPVAIMLREGNAGANKAADHKAVLAAALDQLPGCCAYRVGRKILVRTDGAGGTHEFLNYLHAHGCRTRSGSASPTPRSPQSTWSSRLRGPRPTTVPAVCARGLGR